LIDIAYLDLRDELKYEAKEKGAGKGYKVWWVKILIPARHEPKSIRTG
jgi:hypothetical protein